MARVLRLFSLLLFLFPMHAQEKREERAREMTRFLILCHVSIFPEHSFQKRAAACLSYSSLVYRDLVSILASTGKRSRERIVAVGGILREKGIEYAHSIRAYLLGMPHVTMANPGSPPHVLQWGIQDFHLGIKNKLIKYNFKKLFKDIF